MQRVIGILIVLVLAFILVAFAIGSCTKVGRVKQADAAAPDPLACGNVTVEVTTDQPAELCPGVELTLAPAAVPLLAANTQLSCLYSATVTLAGQEVFSMLLGESYELQPFSDIAPNFENPPAMSQSVTPGGSLIGITKEGTFGYTEVSATFSPGIIAELHVHGTGEFNQRPLNEPISLRQWLLTINAHVDSPGWSDRGCGYDYATATLQENDILKQVAGGLGDGLSWALGWAWDNVVWGLCGLFHGC